RQVLKRSPDGTISVHADLGHIATFHCNDMVVDASGRAYVGNFGFNLDEEIGKRGVQAVLAEHATANLACVSPSGEVTIAAREMHFPNGSVITPDGKTLIVGETLSASLTAFDIGADGVLSNRRVWASTQPAVPDGIALDANGNIWVANPVAPQCVLIAKGGKVVETIDTSAPCYACMLGGEDGRTLFMLTASGSDAHEAAAKATGKLIVATVDAGRAGRP